MDYYQNMEKLIITLIFIIVSCLIIASIIYSTNNKAFKVYSNIDPATYFKNLYSSSSPTELQNSTTIQEPELKPVVKPDKCDEVVLYPDMPCLGFTTDAMTPAMSCGVVLDNIDVSYST